MNITNFRDIGGYETLDGFRVKRGCFYRSSPIVFKTEEDRDEFNELKMKTILDLRSTEEREKLPDSQVENCTYIACSAISEDDISGGDFDLVYLLKSGKIAQLPDYIKGVYKNMPFNNAAFRTLFDLILKDETPVVFHCSAGKDRTGFSAYLILKTLGVDDKTIMYDYMLSNEYRKKENDIAIAQFPQLGEAEEILCVTEACLQSSIDAIVNKYGDFKTYLAAEYNIAEKEIAILKERYLEEIL